MAFLLNQTFLRVYVMNALTVILLLLALVTIAVGGLVMGFIILPMSVAGLVCLMVSALAFPAILAIIEAV